MQADNMTRAEGICVCRNIKQQVNENDALNAEFAEGLSTRASGMEENMLRNTQYPRVTDNMHSALQNMWGALRKWDRNNDFDGDMFAGLDDVELELSAASPRPAPKGRETSTASPAIPAAQATPPAPASRPDPASALARLLDEVTARLATLGLKELQQLRGYPSELQDILNMTSSLRTGALIHGAYLSGKLCGARAVLEPRE